MDEVVKILAFMLAVVGAGSVGYLLIGGVHLFLRGRARRAGLPPETAAEWDAVKGRLTELDHLHTRMTELEERVDFAERMLTRQREAERLAPPS